MNSTVPFILLLSTSLTSAQPPAAPAPRAIVEPQIFSVKPFLQDVPSAAYKIEMVPIPGDAAKNIKPLWFSKTEITWEAFDVYIYRLDEPQAALNNPAGASATAAAGVPGPDGITRPTKPYLPPDRGFGHEGFAAIGMSHKSATEFCTWLSKKTGRVYRLPTEQEWEHACLAGTEGPYCFGDDATKLADYAWSAANAEEAPHPVAKKKPNAWGLYDMHGNIAEWCDAAPDAKTPTIPGSVIKGGSYMSSPEEEKATARKPPDRAWNASDPQIPKSKWWLANAPFIGFRIVCESPDAKPDAKPEVKSEPKSDPKPEGKSPTKP